MKLILIINLLAINLLAFNLLAITQALELKFLNQDPMITLTKGNCRIQTGTIKTIHYINIDEIEVTVNYLSQLTFKVTNTSIGELLVRKINELNNNLLQIKPSERFKRWDTVGHVLKWIGGTPDADDLRIINSTMNELISQNNAQFEVNTQLNERITQLVDSLKQHESTQDRELEAVQLFMRMSDANHILENIMDAILNTKIHQPSNKLWSIAELSFIQDLLNKQGIHTATLENALEFAQPLMAAQKGRLIYILKIPQLREQPGEILKVFTLPVNGKKIIGIPTTIVKMGTKFFTSSNENYVQKTENLQDFNDKCFCPIVKGLNGTCTVETEETTSTSLIAEDKILITNAKDTLLTSTCDYNNQNLTGNFLITFHNCSVNIGNETFINTETRRTTIMETSLHNLNINRTPIEDIIITSEDIKNVKKIQEINLTQYHHNIFL